jgi:hypothetical protein
MGCGDQGHQHQARVTPSQSMTIPGLLHVRVGSNPEILMTSKCFPVYPQLRTLASATGMSQLDQ